mgnify:FL=1
MTNVSVIILTYNEELHLQRVLTNVQSFSKEIVIIDSGSTDRTVEIANAFKSRVYVHPFVNQSSQLNWALDNVSFNGEWILRLDADEVMTDELKQELESRLLVIPEMVSGLYLKRRVWFMGKWIRYGGYYPTSLLRLWRKGYAVCEARKMDEHMKILSGTTEMATHDIIENNLRDLTWWIDKHNHYASREAQELIELNSLQGQSDNIKGSLFGSQEKQKRWIKENIYCRIPLLVRPFLYFLYRYFFKLGFLDGAQGLVWHVLKGFWDRFLVDAKIYESQKSKKSS